MKVRYHDRITAESTVLITVDSLVSQGRILDLTVPGCLIESPVTVRKGDSLQLKLFLPGLTSSISVELAAVRWTKGFRFGAEFLKMNEKDQRALYQIMAQHRSSRATKKQRTRPQFSESAALNWHLDIYSVPE